MVRVLVGILSALLLSACAFTPHLVAVTAQAPTEPSTIGQGITLYLEVIDDRDSPIVGQRGAGMRGADITAPQIISTLGRELKAGFEAKGFRVVSTNAGADAEVEARLRAFKFFIETGFFVGAENTSVVIAVEAKRSGDDYDRTYRSSSEDATMVVPGGSAIDVKLNAALSTVLDQIMSDKKLMGYIAQKPATG